jgi:hypothetical protein
MTELAKRETNGRKGETRTEAFLLDSFWVWRRSVDVGGADFLVQQPACSLDEIRERQKRIEIQGLVQSKFFEDTNEVQVPRDYVESPNRQPYAEFFISIHTDSGNGEHVDYLFSAAEIQAEFRPRGNADGKLVYVFSLAEDRQFSAFKNLSSREKNSRILAGMRRTEDLRNFEYMKKVYAWHAAHPRRVSSNERVTEYGGYTYTLSHQGGIITVQKTSHATGVSSVVGSPHLSGDDPDKYEFDPSTETFRAR